ncbi:hypothetical protein SDC9_165907 [bioreactor metagenome]|uniref:Uncharacterized protein n=1 Tax=bioreactor metagenome TaxID=1076179 RepID=A0A645FVS1_9ZZZZ
MKAAAAGGDDDPGDPGQVAGREPDAVQHRRRHLMVDAAADRVLDGFRLLENLLEHEMRIIALLGGGGVPVDLGDFALDRNIRNIAQVHIVGGIAAMSPSFR